MRLLLLIIGAVTISARLIEAQSVSLQATSPGTQQTGHFNVSGIGIAKLRDLGGQVFNVTAYGAIPNDTGDDTSAIQSAINAAGAGTTYLPPGTYLINAALTLSSSGAALVGAGPGATVLKTTSTTANMVVMSQATYLVPGTSVRDMWFQSDSQNTRTAGAAISIGDGESFLIDNVRIQTYGGNGIVCSSTGSGKLIFASNVDIEIWGAFKGIHLPNAGDVHLSHAWIRGPIANGGTVAGSVGIDVGGGNVHALDVECVQFEKGIFLHPGTGQESIWNTFINVYCDTNSLYGWHFASDGGTIAGTTLTSCWAGTNGITQANGAGLRIEAGQSYLISNFRCINNGGNGVDIAGAAADANIQIDGGFFTGNSVYNSGAGSGILVRSGVSGFRISNTRAGALSYAGNTQLYGIHILSGCDNFILSHNDTRSNVGGGINNVSGTSATRIQSNNF